MGKPNIEKVKLIAQKGKEWIENYKKFELSTDQETAKQYEEISVVLDKCRKILEKESQKSVSKDEIGSIAVSDTAKNIRSSIKLKEQEIKVAKKETAKEIKMQLKELRKNTSEDQFVDLDAVFVKYQDLAIYFLESGLSAVLHGALKADKGQLKNAQEFIAKAEAFISLANALANDQLAEKIENVQKWIESAKKIAELVNAADKYLKIWRDISVKWMENGINEILSGNKLIGAVTASICAEAKDFKKILENFIAEAKKVADKSLEDKLKKAEEMLKMTNMVLDKAGALADNIFKDADKNGLPDWFDLLSNEWKKLAITDLIPGKLDEAAIAKLNAFKAKVGEWLKKATAEISPAINDKIAQAKIWVSNIQKLIDLTQKGKEFVDDLKNKDFNAIYDKLKSLWNEIDKTGDLFAGTDIDNKLLDKLKALKSKAENFASLANSLIKQIPGAEQLGDIESWIKKAMEIASDMAKGEDVVGKYLELAKQWAEGEIKKVIDGAKELTAELAGQVSGFVNEVKKFMAAASSLKKGDFADKINAAAVWIKSSESILDKASEIIGLALEDADKNNLPDWYDKLAKIWEEKLNGKDLIPGMDFDDALIGKLNVFKVEAEKWLAKAVGMETVLKEKIENVKQWIETGSKFLKEAAGFVRDIKEGDYLSVFEKIKKAYAALGNTDDILKGTTVDNKVLDVLKNLKEDAESWIANKLTGGRANGQMTDEVKEILTLADQILTFVLTKQKIEDYRHEFTEDLIVITDPQGRELNQKQIDELLGEFSGGIKDSVNNQLVAVINKINQEMLSLGMEIDAAFRKTIAAGCDAANVYLSAKKGFDSVIKKQQQLEKILDGIRSIAVKAITAVLMPVNPLAAVVVNRLLSGTLTDFTKLAGFLGKTASENNSGALGQIGGFVAAMLPSEDNSAIQNADSQGLVNLNKLFESGVTQKYEEVKSYVSKLSKEIDTIYKNLYKLAQEGMEDAKSSVAGAADKWKNLNGQIKDKYVNAKTTRINQKAAIWLFTRAHYANWLIGKKDTMIIDQVITALTNYDIMKDAGVEWEKGIGTDIAKSLGWVLGGWASFGVDKKVKKLNKWAVKEAGYLSNEAVWKGAFN